MNFAVLTKVKLISGNFDQLGERLKHVTHQPRVHNLAEIAFYHSSRHSAEIYVLSFWFQLNSSPQAPDLIQIAFSKDTTFKIELAQTNHFQLHWEYRLLTHPPVTSHLRLLNLPAGYPEDKALDILDAARTRRPNVDGLISSWIGRDMHNPRLTLQRVDWVSQKHLEAFFYDKSNQEIIANRRAQGIEIEYATRNLTRLIDPLRDPLTGQNP